MESEPESKTGGHKKREEIREENLENLCFTFQNSNGRAQAVAPHHQPIWIFSLLFIHYF
jgi:hypothetical protein